MLLDKYFAVGLVAQSCPTLWDPMDCSLPGSFVHANSPGKNTEWVAMPPDDLPNPRIKPRSSLFCFTI